MPRHGGGRPEGCECPPCPVLPGPALSCLALPRPGRVFTLKPNGGTWGALRLRTELLAVLPACCCGCSVPAELGGSRRGSGVVPGSHQGQVLVHGGCSCSSLPAVGQLWG